MPAHRLWMKSGASGRAVNFDHTAINDDENADIQRPHGNADKDGLEPQAEQRSQVHFHEPGLHIRHDGGDVDGGVRADDPRRLRHDALGHIEHTHDDIPGIGDDEDSSGALEHPFEKHPGIHVMQVVLLHNELDQLQGHHKSQDCPGNGDDDGLGKVLDHVKNAAVPSLGRLAHLYGDVRYLLVDRIEHPGKVAHDAAHQQFFQPVCKRVD